MQGPLLSVLIAWTEYVYIAIPCSHQHIQFYFFAHSVLFGVPPQTLRDRFTDVVDPDSLPGADPLLSKDEETVLVEHVEIMAQMGYGYTHIQLQHLAGELAYSLERKPTSKALSHNWLYGFLRRWTDRLSSLNPRSLETTRAKGSTPEVINNHYSELESVLLKYGLNDKPQLIYNWNETGLQPEHRPPNAIAPLQSKPQAITSPRSTTITLIGCAKMLLATASHLILFSRANVLCLNCLKEPPQVRKL